MVEGFEHLNDRGVELWRALGADLKDRSIDRPCLLVGARVLQGVEDVGYADDPAGQGDLFMGQAARAGEAAISRAMTRRVIEAFCSAARDASGLRPIHGPLTAREWQVIDLLAPGHSTDHVADVLVLSTETVRSHVKNIMRKLGVHSRADAVAAAERLRIAPPAAQGL